MKTQDAILLAAMAASTPQRHDHHHSAKIKVERAPTDDSIRLAKEYEDKAWKAVSARILKDVPGFNAKFVEVAEICERGTHLILFEINGERFRIEMERHVGAQAHEIYNRIAEKLAGKILQHIMTSIPKTWI